MFAKKRRINKSQLALIGSLLLILSGFFILGHHYVSKYNLESQEQEMIEEFFNEEVNENIIESEDTDVQSEKVQQKQEDYNYVAVLEIESINLKRGLVNPNSKYNNVNYNIQIMETSNMPDVENSNLILAGHNGSSYVSFFKNLYKMSEGDLINIYYQGYKYVYQFSNSYEVDKTGIVSIIRDKNKNAITLITCKKNSKDKQLVFIGYLIDKVEY